MSDGTWPHLQALQDHLTANAGRLTAGDVPLGIATLREYLLSGAASGKSLRQVRAQMKPVDGESIQLSYLFNLIVDGATHTGRLAPIESYAVSEFPLAKDAADLLTILHSPEFAAKVGWRPALPGEKQGGKP
ncbi:MAG: hypothetical protein H7338_13060 [Candidatus Sericytochromatia bacterium]|nr:hypothetical protein [Candidatus Sericytochromatia bacterium]